MKTSSVKVNFGFQMIYEVLALLLPFVLSPYISRVIGADGLGTYSFYTNICSYFVMFSLLGMKNHGNRSIAAARDDKDRLDRKFSSLITVQMLLSGMLFIIYILYIFLIGKDWIYVSILCMYVLSGMLNISWFYFGIEKFKFTVVRDSLVKIAQVIAIFLFVKTEADLWIYFLIMSVGAFGSALLLWFPIRRYVTYVRPTYKEMISEIKPLLVLFIPIFAISIYKYMDKIMLGWIHDMHQIGYYDNAEKLCSIPLQIIAAFGTVMLPRMSNYADKKDTLKSEYYMDASVKYIMCLAVGMSFGIGAVARNFAPIYWGEEFIPSGTISMLLVLTVPFFSFANILRTQYLIPNKKDREYVVSVIAGAIVNLVINILLIPGMGAVGAAVGTVAAEVTVCLIQAYSIRGVLPLKRYFSNIFVYIVIGLVMFMGTWFIGAIISNRVIALICQITMGIVIYGIMNLIYFLVRGDALICGIINKVRHI